MIPVIVPIFNRPDYTSVFLDSLYRTKSGVDEVYPIIINNGSRKGTTNIIDFWAAQIPPDGFRTPNVVKLTANKGFSGGVNAGLELLKSQGFLDSMICILHNDTLLTDNWLQDMLECLNADEDTAVVIPTTNYANEQSMCLQETRQKFEGFKPSNKDRMTSDTIENIILKTYGNLEEFAAANHGSQEHTTRYCPEISSFCMLVREGIFTKYGSFDEDFWPRGYEDKFWFSNLQMDGWVCSIAPKAFVHHFGNITSDGPGFSFPDVMRINEAKYKAKMDEKIKNRNQQT